MFGVSHCLRLAKVKLLGHPQIFLLNNHNFKETNLKFGLKQSSHLDVGSNFAYCSCLYLTVKA